MRKKPEVSELDEELKAVLGSSNPKAKMMLAKALVPLAPKSLVSAWAYLIDDSDEAVAKASRESLGTYPEASLQAVLKGELASWALDRLAQIYAGKEVLMELILLNEATPTEVFLEAASTCSERLLTIIANNQERIIERPEIILELEKNPSHLKSTTERLRHFLRLAGIFVPGEELSAVKEIVETAAPDDKPAEQAPEAIEQLLDAENLSEEKRVSLMKYIMGLNVGAKVKLAVKGNREARSLLIKDTNKVVALSVLKSPRITENEIVLFSSLKNVADDVVRVISKNPTWTKNYNIKLNLVNHPKIAIPVAMQFLKFLSLRDLNSASKSKTVLGPVRKAAKQLLMQKRK